MKLEVIGFNPSSYPKDELKLSPLELSVLRYKMEREGILMYYI
jgi:hypothetical protein